MMETPCVPYPAIGSHAVIGDRRTAALVAADGTIDWLCLPRYDGDIVLGSLLDVGHGGLWRLGPDHHRLGRQSYVNETALLTTTWEVGDSRLQLTDFMLWPEDSRPANLKERHAIVRRLRCERGGWPCRMRLHPASNFTQGKCARRGQNGATVRAGHHDLSLWSSHPFEVDKQALDARFALTADEECWMVLASAELDENWNTDKAGKLLEETQAYWKHWTSRLNCRGPHEHQARMAGLLVHLLTYAPAGSVVAAPTTSLPERIGGDWNADYRFTWIRDASLSIAALTLLGNTDDARRYLEWLCALPPGHGKPLQILYGVDGTVDLTQHELKNVYGYRGSKPVRLGNHAFRQHQHDAFGYLLECVNVYLEGGGDWHPEFWELVRRVADHIATVWEEPDNSIWELSERAPYLSGKVMSWVGLDRALKIAERVGGKGDLERWRTTREKVMQTVNERGWSETLGSFRQRLDADNLDAAALLIPLHGLLPPDDSRVVKTVNRIAQRLAIDGFVFRFDPLATPGAPQPELPMGEFEGAFLPCTFWLAHAYALMSRTDDAHKLLEKAEAIAGSAGLFAEGVNPRTGDFLGNSPLLFSQTEYLRAVRALAAADSGQPAERNRLQVAAGTD